jgi:hypothetical protein
VTDPQRAGHRRLSTLSLQFEVPNNPDWPVVRILADGRDPFAAVAPGWQGFDPAKILGPRSPLLPADLGRRVAVYRCSCGTAGCGVIAPAIVPSPDRHRVSWVDFRDYTGVFDDPIAELTADDAGRPWDLPDLHFDREQYIREVDRAAGDGSWETDRRKTARLLYERLEPLQLVLPPNLVLAWTSPPWRNEGVELSFHHTTGPPDEFRQQILRLTSTLRDPDLAAEDIAQQLLSTPPDNWADSFGYPRADG